MLNKGQSYMEQKCVWVNLLVKLNSKQCQILKKLKTTELFSKFIFRSLFCDSEYLIYDSKTEKQKITWIILLWYISGFYTQALMWKFKWYVWTFSTEKTTNNFKLVNGNFKWSLAFLTVKLYMFQQSL